MDRSVEREATRIVDRDIMDVDSASAPVLFEEDEGNGYLTAPENESPYANFNFGQGQLEGQP